ncbi:hypothetical protein TNCT1_10200 [Streptomyces sp. 1-11]|nr:hypothetical protein TNCT1_10200 [Streptomyces sp. 1-11]
MPAGRPGSRVRANRVFMVLAGGSRRCASFAASTLPLSASATSQDSAETAGTSGAPRWGLTCVPEWLSRDGGGTVVRGPGGAGSPARCAAEAAAGARARTPAAHREQAVTATRRENPVIIRST